MANNVIVSSVIVFAAILICGSVSAVGAPNDQWLTGYVLDTSTNPFIVTGDGKELGDPMPVYWDGVWHLYALSVDLRMIVHFTSTHLVKWVEHKRGDDRPRYRHVLGRA